MEKLFSEKFTERVNPFRIGETTKKILEKKAKIKGHDLTKYIRYLCVKDAAEKENPV